MQENASPAVAVTKILMASTSAPTPSSSPSSDVDNSIPDPMAPHISPPVAIVAGTLSGSIVILAAILVLILVRHQRSDDRRRRRESIMRMLEAQHSGPFVGKSIPSNIINAVEDSDSSFDDDLSFKSVSKRSRWSSYRKKKSWRYKLRTTVRALVRPGPKTRRSIFDASSQDTTPEYQHSTPLSTEQPPISTTLPPRSPLDIPPTLQSQVQPPSLLESPPAYEHVR